MIDQLRKEIEGLRAQTRPLEPDSSERRALGEQVLGHALGFLDRVEDAPSLRPAGEAFGARLDPEFGEGGRDLAAILDYVTTCVENPGIATTSPRFMGYIPGGGLFHSGLADLLAATSNKYAGHVPAAPGAVRLENACTQWLASAIDYPATALGTLTSGGSLASAAVSRRRDRFKRSRR